MPRDTTIAQRLRNAGLKVVEVDGWRERGAESFNPRGLVDHHTAGARTGNAPSLGICINGRADLPGPLCNVLIGRDDTCYVIAAGRANHAGKGGWRGLAGNSSVYGVERENVGTTAEPWQPDQTDAAARCHAALIRGRFDASTVCEHKEWSPGRKSDAHTITGDQMRSLVARHLSAGNTPAQEDDMTKDEHDALMAIHQRVVGEGPVLANTNDQVNALRIMAQEIKDAVADLETGGGPGQISDADVDRIVDATIAEIAS